MIQEQIHVQNPHWSTGSISSYPVTRDLYSALVKSLSIHPITYLTGSRRIGKSVLFQQLMHHLLVNTQLSPKQLLFFSFPPRSPQNMIWEIWHYFHEEICDPKQPIYLFFDEVQYVKTYEVEIKQLYDIFPNLKICLTGSLSLSYKRRMQESLTGRFLPFRLFPLSFLEYLNIAQHPTLDIVKKYKKEANSSIRLQLTNTINPTFRNFLLHGRFPEMITLPEPFHSSYLNTIIDQSLSQDAFAYFNINDPVLLRAIYSQLIIQNGGLVTLAKLSSNSSIKTVARYLDILDLMGLTYLIYNTTSPVIKLNSSRKSYVNSAFYLNNPPFDLATSMGFAVESYVLERLLTEDNEVSFWHQRQNEIDFLISKTKVAYEVKYRQNFSLPNAFYSHCEKTHYHPTIITLNQSDSTPVLTKTPAFAI